MPFCAFDDNHADEPAVWALSDGAWRLLDSAYFYAARLMTDGVIPTVQLPRLVPRFRQAHADELLASGLLEPHPLGYLVPGYLHCAGNRPRARIEADRAATAARQERHRAKVAEELAAKQAQQ